MATTITRPPRSSDISTARRAMFSDFAVGCATTSTTSAWPSCRRITVPMPASRSPMMILPSDSSSLSRLSGLTPQHEQPGLARSIREATTSRTPSGASRPKRSTKPSVVCSCSVSPVSSP
ncbi:MAG TPA: hypothetical protein VGV67_14955, partial [Solirubrobacteraceae bacterium]|nr:hypothetical protein [Solirubrobacteraceae bacterium]